MSNKLIRNAIFSTDEKHVLTGGDDNVVRIYTINLEKDNKSINIQPLYEFKEHNIILL